MCRRTSGTQKKGSSGTHWELKCVSSTRMAAPARSASRAIAKRMTDSSTCAWTWREGGHRSTAHTPHLNLVLVHDVLQNFTLFVSQSAREHNMELNDEVRTLLRPWFRQTHALKYLLVTCSGFSSRQLVTHTSLYTRPNIHAPENVTISCTTSNFVPSSSVSCRLAKCSAHSGVGSMVNGGGHTPPRASPRPVFPRT